MVFTRPATYRIIPGLLKSTSSFAKDQAKQMQGAGNPLTGSKTRKPASTMCPACGRWHRPGTICGNKALSHDPALLITKGDKVSHADVAGGNPYRGGSGQFGGQPGGPEGGQAKRDYMSTMDGMPEPYTPTEEYGMSPEVQEFAPNPTPDPYLAPEAQQPFPNTLHGADLYAQPAPEQPVTSVQAQQQFTDGSGYLQGTSQNYMDRLRAWQQRYVG